MSDQPEPERMDVARRESQAVGEHTGGGLSIEQVFQAVIDKQISPENVAVMKELLAMSAEKKFNEAFVRLQADLPVVVASTVVPNRGKYERYEDLMAKIGPILTRHAFTVSFSQGAQDGRIVETCHLSHGGHTRSNPYAVRPGGRSDSETQADCKAGTTAKRNALCNALNIVIRQDCMTSEHDASIEGDYITPEQAASLRERVHATASREDDFLQFAGVKLPPNPTDAELKAAYGRISSSVLPLLDKSLKKKESTK